MAAKFTNSSDESSMGSVVYFSSRVFTENLGEREGEGAVGCQTRPDQEDQSNTVDWILGQKNHLSGNPGEILKRSRI